MLLIEGSDGQHKLELRRNTLSFVGASLGMGLAWSLVITGMHYFMPKGMLRAQLVVQECWHAFCNFTHVLCCTVVFLLFCQGSPSNTRQAGSSNYLAMQSYSEYAYLLWLLALCRLTGSSFGMMTNVVSHPMHANGKPNTTVERRSWAMQVLDTSLGIYSALLMILILCTLSVSQCPPYGGDDRGEGRHTQCLYGTHVQQGAEQQLQQWILYLALNAVYLSAPYRKQLDKMKTKSHLASSSSGKQPEQAKRAFPLASVARVLVRTLLLMVGNAIFYVSLDNWDSDLQRDSGIVSAGNASKHAFNYFALRKWGSLDMLVLLRNTVWLDMLRMCVQFWMGLHAARWFACLIGQLLHRLG